MRTESVEFYGRKWKSYDDFDAELKEFCYGQTNGTSMCECEVKILILLFVN